MLKLIKKLLRIKPKGIYHHWCGNVKKDKSGRLRHKIYIDGKVAKTELSIQGWYYEESK